MKKCSNKQPDFKILEFAENPQRNYIYDLVTSSSTFTKFSYFRLETPIQPYLIRQGAKYVCDSWENGKKILHTGLIPTGIPGYYFGDFAETINDQKKTSLMIFHIIPETTTIKICFFNRFNKRSIITKLQFVRAFIQKKEEATTPPPMFKQQPNRQMLGVENTNIQKND